MAAINSILTRIPDDLLGHALEYIPFDLSVCQTSRSLYRRTKPIVCREFFQKNPFLRSLTSLDDERPPDVIMAKVFATVVRFMQVGHRKLPTGRLLVGTAEEFWAAQLDDSIDRETVYVFSRLPPQFLVRFRAQLKEEDEPEEIIEAIKNSIWRSTPPFKASITRLDLSSLGLNRVPRILGLFPNLRELNMRNNRITTLLDLDDLHRRHPQLATVYLQGNRVDTREEGEGLELAEGRTLKVYYKEPCTIS